MYRNTILYTCLLCLATAHFSAQTFSCGTDEIWAEYLKQDPELRQRHESLEALRYQALSTGKQPAGKAENMASYTLPVVVHIVHQNGAENISDAQVLQGIQHLNAAFANSGYYDNGDGVPTPFQFCLARRTPAGAPTNGIDRVESPLTNVVKEYQDIALKDLSRWDPTKYVNIWLVKEISSANGDNGVAGYAYLPGAHGQNMDGIVMEARWFGSSPAKTGVTIHEMGHYLGLLHTFEGGCTNNDCNLNGDRVCDTPPDQTTAWIPCGATENSCSTDTNSGFATDQNDMTINYMDYATLDCYNAFTQGQSTRMEFFLTTVRKSLLKSNGCEPACANPVTAAFMASAGPLVPVGTTVLFSNASVNGNTYRWTVNNVPVSTAFDLNYLMATPGIVVVRLKVLGADTTCMESISDTFTVYCPLKATFAIDNPKPAPGETIAMTADTSVATQWEWTVNGTVVGNGNTASVTLPNPGVYSVCLTESNAYCVQTLCKTLDIDDPDECDRNLFLRFPFRSEIEDVRKLPDGSWLVGGSEASDSSALFHLTPDWVAVDGQVIDAIPNQPEYINILQPVSGDYVIGLGNSIPAWTEADKKFYIFKYNYKTKTFAWVRLFQSNTFQPWEEWAFIEELPGTGNYLITGHNEKNSLVSFHLQIDKNNGNIIAAKSVQNMFSVVEIYDMLRLGQQIFTAGYYWRSPTDQGAHLTALNAAGQPDWSKYYVSPQIILHTSSITALNNELYLMADGWGNNQYGVVIKTDLGGQPIWAKRLDLPVNTGILDGKEIVAVSDGVILHYNHPLQQRSYLYKLDTAGQLVWSKILDFPQLFYINNLYANGDRLVLIGEEWGVSYDFLIRLDPEMPLAGPCVSYTTTAGTISDITVTVADATLQMIDLPWSSQPAGQQEAPFPFSLSEMCPPGPCPEICDNGLDDDEDGYVDCYDTGNCPCDVPLPACATTDTLGNRIAGRLAWKSDPLKVNSISTPIVANLDPRTDSIPEIIVPQNDPGIANDLSPALLIFRGDGSTAMAPDVLTVPGNVLVRPANFPAVGDIDGDGAPELVVVCADRLIRIFSQYQPGANPAMPLWAVSSQPVSDMALRPFLADFDQDGVPEVFAGTEVFQVDLSNPTAPVLSLVSAPNQTPYGRLNTTVTTQFSCSPVAADLLSPVDCGGDPDCEGLEIAAGNVLYSVDLDPLDGDPVQVKKQRDLNTLAPGAGYSDGYTSVADIDLDGILDVLVAGYRGNQNGVYAWNKTGLLRFFNYPNGAIRGGGIVAVANVYDDKTSGAAQDLPELLATCENRLLCYNLNRAFQTPATPWWWVQTTADLSGSLGVSTFDFNNDKRSEILLRDQNGFRMLYGGHAPFPAGVDANRNWMQFPMGTGTIDEYPVVADLDHDGQAEVAITGHETPGVPPAGANGGRLWVFEADPAQGSTWMSARPLWNQYSYFIVNAKDDLTIPRTQQPVQLELPALGSGKRPLNQFLAQQPLLDSNFDPYVPLPDASVTAGDIRCTGDSLHIRLDVCNTGSALLPAGTPLRLYRGDPTQGAATLLPAGPVLAVAVPVGQCQSMEVHIPAEWDQTVYVVVNNDGSQPTPFNLQNDFPVSGAVECNYLNNLAAFPLPAKLPPLDLGPDVEVCQNGVWVFNAGAGFAAYQWSTLSTDSVVTVYGPGTYWVEARDVCGAAYSDTVQVSILAGTVIELGPDTLVCGGSTIQFDVPGFAEYQWVPKTGLSCGDCPNPVLTALSDTTYTVLAKTPQGCYSVDSIRVQLRPAPAAQLDTALCAGSALTWNGVDIPAGDSQVFYFAAAGNTCDSTFTVTVHALPVFQTAENRAICSGDSALIFGQWRKIAGNYNQVFAAQNGCDSTHTVNLAVLPVFQTLANQTICSGDSALIFGQWRKMSGNYNQVFAAKNGCDSTHTVNLTVLPIFQTAENRAICSGDSALIFGQWRKTAGNYNQVFAAQNGCDSIYTVNLAVLPVFQTLANQTICSGDSALIFGQWRKTSGNFNQVLAAQNGCDSAHTVNLTVLPVFQTAENRAICTGDSALIFGQWRKTSGNYNQVFAAQNGCDSAHTVNLTVLPVFQTQENRTICTGDSALIFGQWRKTAGDYPQIFTAQNGCDSTHTVSLTVLPVFQTQENRSICAGDSIQIFGQWRKTAGGYPQIFNAQNGCDSTHTVSLAVLPLLQTQENRSICTGDSVLLFGQWQKMAGSYSHTFVASGGCDSTHTINLTVASVLQIQEERGICAGDSALIFGQWQKTAGVYSQSYLSAGGCDSTHIITLDVHPLVQTAESLTLCTGDSMLIFGQWQKQSGAYSRTFTTTWGCDSTHTFNLEVLPSLQTGENRTICAGDSVLLFGQWQYQTGIYQQTFTATGGCDSTHVINLAVQPALQTIENRMICAGDSTVIFGQWQKTAGDYQQTFIAQNGCDSMHRVVLGLLPSPVFAADWSGPDCYGFTNGHIEVTAPVAGSQYSLDGVQYQTGAVFAGLAAGAYQVFVRDTAGCVTVAAIQLENPDSLLLELPADTTIVLGQWVQLAPYTNGSFPVYAWSPPDYLDCAACASPVAAPPVSTTYTLTIQDATGCTASGRTTIRVTGPKVYVPNVFQPGSAGANNLFGVYASTGVRQVTRLNIYDRWGGQVYHGESLPADGSAGWDGRWRGQDCAPGVYVYTLELELEDGSRVEMAGEVTVVR